MTGDGNINSGESVIIMAGGIMASPPPVEQSKQKDTIAAQRVNKRPKHCCWFKVSCRWVGIQLGKVGLTRSVHVAVVLSFSSISFPILCTVTWVCLMALCAVWSLQGEREEKPPCRSLFGTTLWTTPTTACWNCVFEGPLNWQDASVLWLKQQLHRLFGKILPHYDRPHVLESLCSAFVFLVYLGWSSSWTVKMNDELWH